MRRLFRQKQENSQEDRSTRSVPLLRSLTRKGVVLIAVFGLLVAVLIAGTAAWYTRVSNISGITLDVATFDVRANYMAGKFEVDAEDYLNVNIKKAAPGTVGCVPIRISSTSQTEVDYSLSLDLKAVAPEILERIRFFYYDKTENAAFLAYQEYLAYQDYLAHPGNYGEGKKAVPKAVTEVPATGVVTEPTRTYIGGSRLVYSGIYNKGSVTEATDSATGLKSKELHYGSVTASAQTDVTTGTDPLSYHNVDGRLGVTSADENVCYEYIYWEWVYEFDANECYNLESGTWGTWAGEKTGVTAADAAARYDRIDTGLGTGIYDINFTSEIDPGNFTKGNSTVTDDAGNVEAVQAYQNALMVKALVTGAQGKPVEGDAGTYATDPSLKQGSTVYISNAMLELAKAAATTP